MKKILKKVLAVTAAGLMFITALPLSGFAEEQQKTSDQSRSPEKVHLSVNNTSRTVADGAAWEGLCIDADVVLTDGDNILTLLKKGLEQEDKSTDGIDENKEPTEVTSICGLANGFDEAETVCQWEWVCYINDKDIDGHFGEYSLVAGNIKNGDKIRFEYEKTDKGLPAVVEDSAGSSEAEGDVGEGTESPEVDILAEESLSQEEAERELFMTEISPQELLKLAALLSPEEKAAYKDTGKYISGQGVPGATEKSKAIGLARADNLSSTMASGYYFGVEAYIKNSGGAFDAAENADMILGLSAIGRDVTSVGGYNLLKNLGKYDYVTSQGVYSAAWALTALDSRWYDIPKSAASGNRVTRDGLVSYILGEQQPAGYWTSSQVSDVEATALAIQALTPYYSYYDEDVREAVDDALNYLSDKIRAGDFYDGTGANAEELSRVIIALTGLGKNLNNNSAYMFNGKNLIDTLLKYYMGNGVFKNTLNGNSSEAATTAAYNALTAYSRFTAGKSSLYSMTDVVPLADKEAAAIVMRLIDAIDAHITRNSEAAIKRARKAYDELSYSAKLLVTNCDKLFKAEQDFAAIKKSSAAKRTKASASSGVAKKANSLINSIFEPQDKSLKLPSDLSKLTKKQLKAILAAYEEYKKLTDTQKKKVARYEEFEALLQKLDVIMHTDKKSGIAIDGIEWKYKLVVKKKDYSSWDIRKIERTTGSNAEVFESYNIYIKDISTGKKFIPNEPITIKIPEIDIKGHKTSVIAHEYADNKYEFIQCEIKDGSFIFSAQTFSPFSVVGFDGTWADIAGAADARRVGLWILFGIMIVLFISIAISSRRMKRANSMERYIKRHITE